MLHWSADYVGMPFVERGRDRSGVDCWGLVWLIYGAEKGIFLPSYTDGYASIAERHEISGLIDREKAATVWRTVTGTPRDFDVVLFRTGGIGSHVGLVAGRDLMLHVVEGQHVRIENYCGPRFSSRMVGIYRHERLLSEH